MSSIHVPPEGPTDAAIVFVGEAPGATEVTVGRPFVGKAGRTLNSLLNDAKIVRDECYLTNLVKERPPNNKIEYYFSRPGVPNARGEEHVAAFWKEMATLQPNVIVPLGVYPTALLLGENFPMNRVRGHVEWTKNVCAGRGGCKVIPTWHPAAVLRQFNLSYLVRFDLRKVAREADHWSRPYIQRLLSYPDTGDEAIWELQRIADTASEVAFDFETDPSVAYPKPLMISFAPDIRQSVCVPILKDGEHQAFSPMESLEIARLVERIMRDPDIRKVAQNAMFDLSILATVYGVRVRNLWMDTMLAHACLYPSLAQGTASQRSKGRAGKKDLEFLSSLYTNEPMHKKGRTDLRTMNAMDSAITLEIAHVLDAALESEPSRYADYRRQAALIEPLLACTVKGIGWDKEAQEELFAELTEEERLQRIPTRHSIGLVMDAVGYDPLDWVMLKLCKARYKKEGYRTAEYWAKIAVRRSHKPEGAVARAVVDREPTMDLLLECVNPASTQQIQHILFDVAQLPIPKDGKSSDDEVLRGIIRRDKNSTNSVKSACVDLARNVLELRRISKALNTYAGISVGVDGRFRCTYNVAGAYTARLSSGKWFDQGMNVQNFPQETRSKVNVRKLLRADPGMVLLGHDLMQAEDRYVAWDANDPVAMKMYRDGLDVYSEIAAWVFQKEPDETTKPINEITKEERYICKRAKLAYNYGIGPRTLAAAFAKDGFDHVDERMCKWILRRIATLFPGIERWKNRIEHTLKNREHLVTPFGRKTRFMDRRDDSMFRQGYAFCPQSAVVEITNQVLRRIYDEVLPEEPSMDLLMQQHDEIISQVPLWDAARINDRILPLYDIPLHLTGGTLRIPVEVQVGVDWGEMYEVGSYHH